MEIKFIGGEYKVKINCLAYEKLKIYAKHVKSSMFAVGLCEREKDKNVFRIVDFEVPQQTAMTSSITLTQKDFDEAGVEFMIKYPTIINPKAYTKTLAKSDNVGKVAISAEAKTTAAKIFEASDWYILMAFNKTGELVISIYDNSNGVEVTSADWELDSQGLINEDEIKADMDASIYNTTYCGTTTVVTPAVEEKREPSDLVVKKPDIRNLI